MSVLRQFNFIGNQRIDVPHLRAIESSIAADFDCLAGAIVTGLRPMVVRGFTIQWTPSDFASNATLNVTDGLLLHSTASYTGTLYRAPADRTTEFLDSTRNSRVVGSFVPGQINYVGLDLVRNADSSTSDVVYFLDDSGAEVPKVVPLARVIDYKVVITTEDFSLLTNILPIAKVTVASSGGISAVEDAREMLFSLGAGGSIPDGSYSYQWQSRNVFPTASFTGGDKDIYSMKDWMNAVMTRLWELGGGPRWYSPTSDRDVKMVSNSATTFSNGEFFDWDGTNLKWRGVRFVFANGDGAAYYNDVADNLGGVGFADGACAYVDLDRSTNASIGARVTQSSSLATIPDRYVIAWRSGTLVFTRDGQFPVGRTGPIATELSNGMVCIHGTPTNHGWPDDLSPKVPIINDVGEVIAYGLTRGTEPAGNLEVGTNANDNTLILGRAGQNVAFRGSPTYSSTKTRYKVISGAEMQVNYFDYDAVFTAGLPAEWSSNLTTGLTFGAAFQAHLPSGSTITQLRILADNTDTTDKDVEVYLGKIDNSSGSPYTVTPLFDGTSGHGLFTIPASTLSAVWSANQAPGTTTTIGDDCFVCGMIVAPAVTATKQVGIKAIKITYTQPGITQEV